LIISIAESRSGALRTLITGPNISSLAIVMSGVTSSKIEGPRKQFSG